MIKQILDLHIHSKYARACSPLLELPNIAKACERKGIDICATGDFTHPAWMKHIKENLEEIKITGLYSLKQRDSSLSLGMTKCNTKFILATEVSCVYKHLNKTRRLHLLLIAPSIEAAERLNQALTERGANLRSDGRPIMGISAKEVLQIMLKIDRRFVMIPAHAWTPWFAVFGSKSGYDSLEECFEELTPHIFAIETGLSSDPSMNHRLSQLDKIALVSNSDAHSLENLGREANVLAFEKEQDISFDGIMAAIKSHSSKKFLFTIEFYPQEGMYYADGHRECGVSMLPNETKKNKNICPKCKKELTIGVMYRVDALSDRKGKEILDDKFIPHKYIVPLREIIAEAFSVGKKSKKVEKEYAGMVSELGNEFYISLDCPLEKITKCVSNQNISLGIANMRLGKVKAIEGFDGQYGQIKTI